jgi:type I restriction enzyme S subunit
VNINNLRREHLENIQYRLAPAQEQKRIVEKLDVQFTRLNAAVAALKRVQANLKRSRSAVLKAACEGRLVLTEAELARREGRPFEPASILLVRMLAERRRWYEATQSLKWSTTRKASSQNRWKGKYKEPAPANLSTDLPDLPMGWCWATAEQCTTVITDGEHITPERSQAGVLLLSARNVLNGKLSLDEVDYISPAVHGKLKARLSIEPGDTLLSCSGTVGRSCTAPNGLAFSLVRSVAVLKPIFAMGEYLSLALRSPFLQSQIVAKQTQTAQSNIFQGKIRTLIFPLPPIAEQVRILAEAQRLLSIIETGMAETQSNKKKSERLRQSILKRAFEGKLVPQDPDDEPASTLLDRIRAEREAKSVTVSTEKRTRKAVAQ